MPKSASELVEDLAVLVEKIKDTAEAQVRGEIADHFLDMVKHDPGELANYLRDEDVEIHGTPRLRGTQGPVIGVTHYRSYLPKVSTTGEMTISEDFLNGVRFMCSALKDKNLEL